VHVWNCDQESPAESSRHWSMVKMGKIKIDFTESEVKSSLSKLVNGKRMYKLFYDVELDLFSERGDLQLRTILNGTTKSNATIQFEESYDVLDTE
jgi:hypothetical protein